MYEALDKHLESKGLKIKADARIAKKDAILKKYKDKEKSKPLSDKEKIRRLEELNGI